MGGTGAGPIGWFVRHAQSIWNEAGLAQGQGDAPGLSEQGRAQAQLLAERLSTSGARLVLSSDLRRAVETARPIAERLEVPLRTDRQLRERALGTLEGGPFRALVPSMSGFGETSVIDPDARPPGGESLRELYDRVARCIERLRSSPPAPAFVLVSHGGFLRIANACVRGVPLESITRIRVPNGLVWRVDFSTGEIVDESPSGS